MNPVLKAALAFSGKGIPVFPCRDKKPLTENGFKDASTSPAIITKWFDVEDPTLQLAIPTGSKTGMLVIDLDGARPRDRFSLLGTLPDTRMVHTSSGKDGEGEHIQVWLQQPPGAKTKCSQGKLVKGKLTGFGPGIDVRGDGGYVISPPSKHSECNDFYEFLNNLPLAPAPEWLLTHSVVAGKNGTSPQQAPLQSATNSSMGRIPVSQRHTWLMSQAARLKAGGAIFPSIFETLKVLLREQCEPGGREISDDELRKMAGWLEDKPAAADDTRPRILCVETRIPIAVDEAEQVLVEHAEELRIFQRSGDPIRIVIVQDPFTAGRVGFPVGTALLDSIDTSQMQQHLDRLIHFQRFNRKGDVVGMDCPSKVASFYLGRRGDHHLPYLTGTISAPILRLDGSVFRTAGYDKESGLYLLGAGDWPEIPDEPSRDDALEAADVLLEPFSQFPFVGSTEDAENENVSVLLAMILTAIERRLLPCAPGFAITAPEAGTGKSLLASGPCIIATGVDPPATEIGGDEEEIRKAVTAVLWHGAPCVRFDNREGAITSSALCIALTEPSFQARVLGESRMVTLPTNVMVSITGNNLVIEGDLTPRFLMCSLDAAIEHPEERSFRIQNLRQYLIEHRRELAIAAVTILRAFHVAGRPRADVKPYGRFTEWDQLIRHALLWLGFADPALTVDTVRQADQDRNATVALLSGIYDTFQVNEFTVPQLCKLIGGDQDRAGFNNDLRDAVAAIADSNGTISRRILGDWFRQKKDRVLGGFRLRQTGSTMGRNRWKVERVGNLATDPTS